MFQLIVAIISILLIAALSLASLYYGGDAMTSGAAKSAAATFVNQGQQVAGAHALYKTGNGGTPVADGSNLSELVTGEYLAAVPTPPKGSAWVVEATYDHDGDAGATTPEVRAILASGTNIGAEIHAEVNAQAGTSGVFGSNVDDAGTPGDATDDIYTVWYKI